ncbi:hypothetical protein JVX92_11290 [Microbacterium hominis]|nr:hypothetical protein JVX92_11290 [Microbacterium hominis]
MTMMTHPARIDGPLELIPIDDDAWRLCDTRAGANDAEFVVAYIERGDDGYDAVWMRGPRRRSRHRRLDECLSCGHALLRAEESSTASRPIPIAHFPPARAT